MVEARQRRPAPAAVLVVDDEVLIRDTLAEVLSGEGYAVAACASAEEALTQARDCRFDAAICDVQLPGMDGLELLDRLHHVSPETFVLLITAYATVENAVEAFQRGAHDYLMKPILLDEVLVKLRRLLAQRASTWKTSGCARNSTATTIPNTWSAAARPCARSSPWPARRPRRGPPC